MKITLLRALVAAPLLTAAFNANAILVVGTSDGVFSNLSSCDYTAPGRTCRITSSGTSSVVEWGSQSSSTDFVSPSRLVSVDRTINVNTDNSSSLGVVIGQLDWYNSATIARDDLNSFGVSWSLVLAFTAPSADTALEVFNLTIINPINPTGDTIRGLQLTDLSSLASAINLAGVSISNLRYVLTDGAGAGTSTFTDNRWYNDENNWSTLRILADFRTTVRSVPEPASVALLGVGLLAMGAMRRRSQRKSETG